MKASNHDEKPAAFNPDCVVNYKTLIAEVSLEMERLEESEPLTCIEDRKWRYRQVYDKIRLNYKTYREMQF